MMTHPLDRPAWSALTGPHAALAEGEERARRYRAGTVPFAAAADTSPDSLAALAALPKSGEVMALVEANSLTLPPGMVTVKTGTVVQMELAQVPNPEPDERIEKLTWQDAEEMLALATLTQPGPFTLKAQELGDFYGIRVDGRLVAMAGHRMKQVGYSELSGVCTHPDFRRQGLARVLSIFVTHLIVADGETPYLHAWAENTPAITLYQSLGFVQRATMNFAAFRREE
jgi:ribosomal protein S18 acetylase RimI-like enzyme